MAKTATVFICMENSSIKGVGNSLLKLFNNTLEMQTKSYHCYSRKLKEQSEISVLVNNVMLKIIKVTYAK